MDYYWTNTGGGDFSDPDNWTNSHDKNPSGPPGAGDTASIQYDVTISVSGQTVSTLDAGNGATLDGDFTATHALEGGGFEDYLTLTGGNFSAGTAAWVDFTGSQLTAHTINFSTLESGQVQAGTLNGSTVAGADVDAQSIGAYSNLVTSGSLDVAKTNLEDGSNSLEVDGGSFTTSSLTVGGAHESSGQIGFGLFFVAGGTATISGRATLVNGSIGVGETVSGNLTGGGTLICQDGLSLVWASGENSLTTYAGGTTTIAGAALVDMEFGNATNVGLVADGGTITSSGVLTLGKTQIGALNVVDGGHADIHEIVAGSAAPSSGYVYIDGQGSRLTVGGTAEIGNSGEGFVQILDGATANIDTLVLGSGKGGYGSVDVIGTHSKLDVATTIAVGEKGVGSLEVENGAVIDPADLIIAGTGSHTGGPTSTTTHFHTDYVSYVTAGTDGDLTTGNLIDGENGYAYLSSYQGTLTTNGAAIVAELKGSEGQVNIDDGTWTVDGELSVGDGGKALIDIGAGGALSCLSAVTVGEQKGSSGKIALGDGTAGSGPGTLGIGGELILGAMGSGTLIADGSGTEITADVVLGQDTGATGKLTVAGGSLTSAGDMMIGDSGSGSVIVSAGGSIGPGSLSIPAGATDTITLGEATGAKGSLSVSGTGSSVTSAELVVGSGGSGSLTLSEGASLDTTGSASLGDAILSTIQKASLSKSAEWIVGGSLSVGAAGIAQVTVSSGSSIQAGNVALGEDKDSSGTVTVSGSATVADVGTVASALNWTDILTVGDYGIGALRISGGAGVAPNKGGRGIVEIAAASGSSGTVSVSGTGSSLVGTALAVGGTAKAAGGIGSLTVGAGATASFGSATIWAHDHVAASGTIDLGTTVNDGTLDVAGGMLVVTGGMTGTGNVAIADNGSFTLDASATKTANMVHITTADGTFDLQGGSGNDTFKLAMSDLTSSDIIIGGAGNDKLVFTTAGTIAASSFAHVRSIDTIDLANGTNDVTLNNAMVAAGHDLAVYLSTGTGTLDASGIAATDTLTFHVAGGNDSITGGAGDNVYDFADGTLAIDNAFTGGAAAHGKLEFGTGLSDESLWFAKSGHNLVIDVLGTSQTVTIEDWYGINKSARLDALDADGLHIGGKIADLVQAMAAYETAHPGFDPAESGTIMPSDAALQHAITTDWVT